MIVISDARAELWRYPLAKPAGSVTAMDVVVTTLTGEDGQTGTGFVPIALGVDDLPLRAAQSLLERFVCGRELEHPVALWRRLVTSFGHGVRNYRTGFGPHFNAIASIDVAAWDLYAKTLGVPLGVAMGGTMRRMPVYGSGRFARGQDPEEAADIASDFMREGRLGIKVRVQAIPQDAKLLRAVAERIDGKVDLMMDANQRGNESTAPRLLREAAEVGALFVEEPLPVTHHAGYEALARTSPCPIATGENFFGSQEAAPYLINRWCSVIQPDLTSMAGLTECLRTAQLAEHCNVEVAPHFFPGLFIQLAACTPHMKWLEDFPTIEPLFSVIPETASDGYMSPPEGAGHGLVLSDDARAEFRIG
jgi:L-alanine-DL-glutamate epimerase-like enolase superfamily enzyme